MEELYKVMDDLLDVEFQMKSGIDLLKELEEFYMLEKETEESEARKVAVLMKGYLQSMKSNLREIIHYIDDTTLKKSNDEKKEKQESSSVMSEEVQEFVNLTIVEHMGKAYSEWKLKQDTEPASEIEKKYQELLETLSPEQEEVITEYCNAIFSSGADTEEFFYRLGLKDGLNLKSTVKSTLEMLSGNIRASGELDETSVGFFDRSTSGEEKLMTE
ncbi:MAG: hypothetical protein PUF14_12760 [Clostridiales bacterium]|nr:hypothetical protein [Clostridiales bacterium]